MCNAGFVLLVIQRTKNRVELELSSNLCLQLLFLCLRSVFKCRMFYFLFLSKLGTRTRFQCDEILVLLMCHYYISRPI